jgi:uncharacterized protein YndB with AHSA1/START domain
MEPIQITIQATVDAPVEKAWNYWTSPEHITKWNNASADWHTPWAKNDLRPGGKFQSRMESTDGSMGFDFEGIYETVIPHKLIEYLLGDGRKVSIVFTSQGNSTGIVETFEAETTNSVELQRNGWQAILDNFKRYAEEHTG